MGRIKHSHTAAIQVQDQSSLGVDADAIAGEVFPVVAEAHAVGQLQAGLPPGLDDGPFVSGGGGQPSVDGSQETPGQHHAIDTQASFDVEAGGGVTQRLGKIVSTLMAVDADAQAVNPVRVADGGIQKDATDLFAVQQDVVGPLDPCPPTDRLCQCHGGRQGEQFGT